MQVTYLRHDNDHPRGIRALTRLSLEIFDWGEGEEPCMRKTNDIFNPQVQLKKTLTFV